jgi:hypothetical protein
METAREVAPEIDRLALAVHDIVMADHGPWVTEASSKVGLSGPGMSYQFAEFLLAGQLTTDIAERRSPYWPTSAVNRWLDELAEKELIVEKGGFLAVTSRFRPFLEGLLDLMASVAAELWSGYEATIDIATAAASEINGGVTDDFVVAAAHGKIPDPEDRYLRLHKHLYTLRYIRQHAHVEAWRRQDLTAGQMVLLTKLWLGETPEPDEPDLGALVEREYVEAKHPKLSSAGRLIRDRIEVDTNHLAQPFFDILDDDSSVRFAEALHQLPGDG